MNQKLYHAQALCNQQALLDTNFISENHGLFSRIFTACLSIYCLQKWTPSISPAPNGEGEGKWMLNGPNTLVFTPIYPDDCWNNASKYTILVPKGIRSEETGEVLENDFSFFFRTPTVKIKDLIGLPATPISSNPYHVV